MSAALLLTNQRSAMRTPEQVSMDEYQDARAVFAYLKWSQRTLAVIRSRTPMDATQKIETWVKFWHEIKGGLVWCGYSLDNLIRAAKGYAA